MECLEGGTLAEYFEQRDHIELEDVRYIAAQIIEVLGYLHS